MFEGENAARFLAVCFSALFPFLWLSSQFFRHFVRRVTWDELLQLDLGVRPGFVLWLEGGKCCPFF